MWKSLHCTPAQKITLCYDESIKNTQSKRRKDYENKENVILPNPMSSDKEIIRTTLIPSLLNVYNYNKTRKVNDILIYEIAKTYDINYNEDSGLLILQKDNKFGITDLNGKQILNVEYDQIQIPGNYILATKNGNSETYDLSGTKQEDLRYANVLKTANENYSITIDTNDKYGVISKDGNTLIENKYNYIQYLYDNYFIVGGDSGKSGIVNDKGEEILPTNYEVIQKLDNKIEIIF